MSRVRLSAVLIAAVALALSACGSEPAPDATGAPTAESEVAYPVAAPPAMMPADAPPQEEEIPPGDAVSALAEPACADAIGQPAAARLVERCIAVSPATRPPCNVENPCALIQGEIDRSCAGFGADKPAECAA